MEELLQSVVDAQLPRAEAKKVALGLEKDPSLPRLDLDATRMAQVVGNLLDNAITHTPEDGRVTVSAHAAAGTVIVTVSDTGSGIAPEDLPRLFDRFYRADPSRARSTGGTGLGLTIARRIVEAHGGSTTVESAVGQGSRFMVRLPTAQQRLSPGRRRGPRPEASILITVSEDGRKVEQGIDNGRPPGNRLSRSSDTAETGTRPAAFFGEM